MEIAVIGTGYVGLVSGTCFADSGNHVVCVDNDQNKLEKLSNGVIPIYEPGLDALFYRSVREGRLNFTSDLKSAVTNAEVIFLCLPTPPGADGQADLSFVLNVADEIAGYIEDYKIIVNKSTVPVGTADRVKETIEAKTDVPFDVVSNPEFLREGAAVDDFLKPERVVIGSSSQKACDIMTSLYEPFVRSGNPIITMDERSAEITKYAANAFLATKITFMNEIANVCEQVGANVDNVRKGVGTDSRIGKRFLFSGIGYGGSCFPKDVQAIHRTAKENNYDFRILESVMNVNETQKTSIVRKIAAYYGTEDLSGKTFGLWGLSFKPETDDIREAPSLYITEALTKLGARIKAYDPEATENFKKASKQQVLDSMEFENERTQALKDIDALIIATEWNEFRQPDFEKFKHLMKAPVIFDGRNLFDLSKAEKAGLTYFSVGRPAIKKS